MFDVHKSLARFGEVMASGVSLLFLTAGTTAMSSFFGGGLVGIFLAAGADILTFLFIRGVADKRRALRHTAIEDYKRAALKHDRNVQQAWLGFLIVFQMWNMFGWLQETWTPPTGVFPGWTYILARAVTTPLIAMLAAYFAPELPSVAERITAEAHSALDQLLTVIKGQRTRKLKSVRQSDHDLSTTIEQIARAAGERQAGALMSQVQKAIMDAGAESVPGQSPDRPVSPASHGTLQLVSPRLTRREVEDRARSVFVNGMSTAELARRAGITIGSAARWHRELSQAS